MSRMGNVLQAHKEGQRLQADPGATARSLEQLAASIANLVEQMRREERLMQQWSQQQTREQAQMQQLLREIAHRLPPRPE